MASKRQLQEIGFSHAQSASDFNSKAQRERREQGQQDRQTRRWPATALAAPHSSNSTSADRDRLRSLPRLPSLPQVDSGAHSLNSSTGDLVQDPDFPSKGDLLIQKFSEAIKFGEESNKRAKKAEAENAVLLKENQEFRQALDGTKRNCEYVRNQYMNIPPKEALNMLEEVEALDPANAHSSAVHNGDHRSGWDAPRKTNSGKKLHAHTSGTDADAESNSSSSFHTSAALPSRPAIMASKRQLQEIGFSHAQSASDFNSKAQRERREQGQQDRQTRRRPAAALAAPHSSNSTSADRDRLRSLPRLPSLPQVDSGAHSLNSSTGDLVQDPDFPSKGDLLIQKFSEAIKFGEESNKRAKKAEAENAVLLKEIQELRQALDGMKGHCEYVRNQYMNIPPKEALNMLEEVEALDPANAHSSAVYNGDHRSGRDALRKASLGKKKLHAHTSGTDADAESTSSSSSPSLQKHHLHKAQGGFCSDDMVSCKEEESVAHSVAHHKGSSEVYPVNTD